MPIGFLKCMRFLLRLLGPVAASHVALPEEAGAGVAAEHAAVLHGHEVATLRVGDGDALPPLAFAGLA